MMANSTLSSVKILAVPGMHVIHEPCIWPISPQVLRSSVVRASDGCTEGHRFNSSRGLRFFLCPILVTCWSHHFSSLLCFFYSVQVWQLSVLHHFLSSLNTKHAHNIMPSSWHWVQSCKLLLFVVLERWSGIPFQVVEAVLLIAVTLLLVVQMPQPINLLYWDLHWTGYPSHHLRCHFLHQQMHRGSWILRLIMPLVKIKFS